jgi:hypothetical protein
MIPFGSVHFAFAASAFLGAFARNLINLVGFHAKAQSEARDAKKANLI